jgi:hypothetical protein
MNIKNIHIFGGGTVNHISNHFAVSAPAYGGTARKIKDIIELDTRFSNFNKQLELTKMAGGCFETNLDIETRIEVLKRDLNTKIVFFNCALVDWEPISLNFFNKDDVNTPVFGTHCFGKYEERINSSTYPRVELDLFSTPKIIPTIRNDRKDIFLVGFKTTCGATKEEMYLKGLKLCKEGSCNLVLVNDTKTRENFIICPEEATYCHTTDRQKVLRELVDMTYYRSHLTFTQSTVVDGKSVSWNDDRIPTVLKQAVMHCIKGNAYKPFNGSTVGHFAVKLSDTEFLTSIRKSNFNDIEKLGMVYVKTDGPDTVIAYGAKPSVGGQSQRIVFKDHEGMDCILHFHSPLKSNHLDDIPVASQRNWECGSHECGSNTSANLKQFGNLKAVMLDNHGPNIVFSKNIDIKEVISFIDRNFDLSLKTGGYNLI